MLRRALLERIGAGVLVPGERIMEARLAEEFGGSAIPVREAIRELVSMGVLAAANNKGAWVREAGMGGTADALEGKAVLELPSARSSSGQCHAAAAVGPAGFRGADAAHLRVS